MDALSQHRVVAWLLCRHPESVSQLLLRVDTCRGALCLARGSVLADLLMDFRQPTVKVQGRLHHTLLTDLLSGHLGFLSFLDRTLQCSLRFPELIRTHGE